MFSKNALYFIFLSLLMISACKKAPNYPKEPSISLKEFRVISDLLTTTDTIVVSFDFKDGDGDIGNAPLKDKDFFIEIWRTEFGTDSMVLFAPSYDGALPLLSGSYNVTGPIDGTITRRMDFPVTVNTKPHDSMVFQYDTLRFKMRIKDRANNYSNWIETDTMVLWRNF